MLADDNRDFIHMISDYIGSQPDMEVVAVAYNGEEALQILHSLPAPPDILLLDIIMPHLDGLGVLEHLNQYRMTTPKVIMITAFGQEHITTRAVELGASYYMLKPFDVQVLGERIRQLGVSLPEKIEPAKRATKKKSAEPPSTPVADTTTLERDVTAVLHDLSIPAHIKGYHYLRDAIILVYQSVEVLGSVTNVLYPAIADKHQTKSSRVERAIRHAIGSAWEKNKLAELHELRQQGKKPTNSEVIATIADRLRLKRQPVKSK